MLTAKVTMLISMEIKWTCMHYKPIWQRLKHNFVWVIKCMRVLPTANLYVKLCKMLSLLLFIYQWETVFSINLTIANFYSKQLLHYFLTFPKIKEFSCCNLLFKNLYNYGLENNSSVTSLRSSFTIQILVSKIKKGLQWNQQPKYQKIIWKVLKKNQKLYL